MKRICARCGIEFERGNGSSRFCHDCAQLHYIEASRERERLRREGRMQTKRVQFSIGDIIKLAPLYGFEAYEYGMTVSKIERAAADGGLK